ncbi:6-bladed beta-propeller [Calothrix sp. HK-06]|nr:6-bladed beta-propeller [Calothrix sp. HK-06]
MGLVKNLSLTIASAGCMFLAATSQAFAVSLTFDKQIGEPGFGPPIGEPGELFVPQGITVEKSTGNVYVSNGRGLNPDGTFNPAIGNRVEVYDQNGTWIKAVGEGGKGIGQFDEPSALEFSPKTGNLYVGDVFNNRVNVYDPNGNFINSFGEFGGLIPGRAFFGPSGVTFDKDNNVYIGDFSGDKINKYTPDGQLIGSIGTSGTAPGQFQGPAGVRISPVSGNFYVSDQFNNRVQVLDPTGKPLLTFGEQGTGPGQFNQPIGIEVDDQENIYVADSINSRVQVFDKNGKFLTSYGEVARDASGNPVAPPKLGEPPFGTTLDLTPGRFNWTAGTALSGDKLYVGDFFQGRVQVLNIDKGSTKVPEPGALFGFGLLGLAATNSVIKRRRQRKLGKDLLAKVELV